MATSKQYVKTSEHSEQGYYFRLPDIGADPRRRGK
jgi:hypothetical protein